MPNSIHHKFINTSSLEKAKILVVGDVMLDRYWQGVTDRISPEAPVPVVKINDKSMRVGGAGNVAVNITSLGGQATLIGMVGDDEAAKDLSLLLNENDVVDKCVSDKNISTTIKLRILAQHQQLIRLDFEEDVSGVNQHEIDDLFDEQLTKVNLVVLSDYGKGVVSDTVKYIKKANQQGVKVLIDPKKNDFSEYAGAYLVTPNKKEFEAVVGACNTQKELEEKARNLIKQHTFGGMLVTQGADGMTLLMDGQEAVHFSTLAREVYDVTGAGDTVIASLATAISSGMFIEDAVHLSCIAAGVAVGRIGTAKVTLQDIIDASKNTIENADKLCTDNELLDIVKMAKKQGRKIIMTNGCFDILHAGHVQYLEKSAALGDIFIVAVNSDASVKALKGETRPINALENRIAVLAGLGAVDYIVSFNEETPENLICTIKPNVLVKGGDYIIDDIAGRHCVDEVVLIDLLEGQSTSNVVSKIKNLKEFY